MSFPVKHELRLGEVNLKSGSPGATTSVNSGTCYSLDQASYDIVGDLDIRIEATADDWTPPASMQMCGKNKDYGLATANWSWNFFIRSDGKPEFDWTTSGAFGTAKSAVSTAATAFTDGTRHALRVTIDVDNGASGYTVTFYTSSSIDGSWVALGSPVTVAGVTSIASTAGNLEISSTNMGVPGFGNSMNWSGKIHAFEMRSGIAGTVVSRVDFSTLQNGVTAFTDLSGNAWSVFANVFVDEDWIDVTADTYNRAKVNITRGRSSEGQRADAQKCSTQLDNTSGNYSPRNPNGIYYGHINRNTQQRVSITGTSSYLWTGGTDKGVWCVDTAGLSVTSDLDLAWDGEEATWKGLGTQTLITKFFGTQLSYALGYNDDGTLLFQWSSDGTAILSASSTQAVPLPYFGRKAVRATIDVNNGASGRTITFYTSDTLAGSWTQLGSPVVQAGTTSIFDSTSELVVRGIRYSRVFGAYVKNSIAGTTVASPDFTSQTVGVRSFTDAQSNIWRVSSISELTNRIPRFAGEVGAWPQSWDETGRDVYSPIQGAGILRRLGQGNPPVHSTVYTGTISRSQTKAYWPCEDSIGSTQVSSGLPSGQPGVMRVNTLSFQQDSSFNCSEPLPLLNNCFWSSGVNDYNDIAGDLGVQWLLHVPAPLPTELTLVRWWCKNSTVPMWQLNADASGNLRLQAFNALFTKILDSGLLAHSITTQLLRISVELVQSGTSIGWTVSSLPVGASVGLSSTGTLTTNTLGQCSTVEVNPGNGAGTSTIGHVTISSPHIGLFAISNELAAWNSESAGDRVRRLCDENGIGQEIVGAPDLSVAMGPQLPKTLLDLLRECEDADLGILYEPTDYVGVAYRTRESLEAQADLGGTRLTLNYATADLTQIEPVDDDQHTQNDVTVSRVNGGSAEQVLTDGPMSMNTVGRYTASATINNFDDPSLVGQANWRLHLGTVDEARYPNLGVMLARTNFTSSTSQTAAVRAVDVGDKVVVTNPPSWVPPDQIQQIAQGYSEVLDQFTDTITFSCVPETPYQVGVYNHTASRYEVNYSNLGAAATSGTTSLTVSTPSGPLWGTADLPYDVIVEGERMTVTAVSGMTSPQTFTVTRSVNGIVKAHGIGAEVRLFKRVYYSM